MRGLAGELLVPKSGPKSALNPESAPAIPGHLRVGKGRMIPSMKRYTFYKKLKDVFCKNHSSCYLYIYICFICLSVCIICIFYLLFTKLFKILSMDKLHSLQLLGKTLNHRLTFRRRHRFHHLNQSINGSAGQRFAQITNLSRDRS